MPLGASQVPAMLKSVSWRFDLEYLLAFYTSFSPDLGCDILQVWF